MKFTASPHHADNRERFISALNGDAALFFGASHHFRNADTEFRYRQHSDVLYLSGWTQPDVALLFRPQHPQPFVMFVQPRDPSTEQWAGARPGPEGAVAVFGADAAYSFSELGEKLPSLLQGYDRLHYRFADHPDHDQLVAGAVRKARKQARYSGLDVPDTFVDPARILHELRVIKTPAEIDLLRHSARISLQGHLSAMAATKPGAFEYELEAALEGTFRRMGGSGPGYPSIVGGGNNATVLHYMENNAVLRDGDLVCVDAGCEYQWYTTDVTRTWPVNGTFSPAQRDLYEVVLLAQKAAIETARAGQQFLDAHNAAVRTLTEGMVSLGLLEGDVDELIAHERYKKHYMHGTGHWLGLDVHDVGGYARSGTSRVLEAGMVLTIEPGLYVSANDTTAPEAFRGMGIRIEDDVLVTAGAPDVLTADIPKSIDDVEAAVRAGR